MLEFRVLGPIEVLSDGTPVELGKGMERALLAALVLSAGEPVTADELVSALWNERPPPTAPEMLRNVVARLRGRLGRGVIETTPAGYRLAVGEDAVDARRFERLSAAGTTALEGGDPGRAARDLHDALALWRGRAAPELDEARRYSPVVRALEELRLRVEEDRLDAELALGHAPALVHEIEALHDRHPYRERLLGQLMLALYQGGRQKDALDRYGAGRRRLVDEVGLEPGPELQELQRRILQQDPALRGATRSPAPSGRVGRRPVVPVLVGVAVLFVAAVAAAWPRHVSVRIPGRGVVAFGADGRARAAGELPVRGLVAVSRQQVWVAANGSPAVVAVPVSDLRRPRVVRAPRVAFSLVAAGGSAWMGDGFDGTVTRIDMGGVSTFRPEPRSQGRLPLGATGHEVWIASQDGTLTQLDGASGRVLRSYGGVGQTNAIAVGGGDVWLAAATADVVARFDARAGRIVARVPIGGRPSAAAVGDGAVWALTPAEGALWRIDPERNAVVGSIPVPTSSFAIAITPGRLWIGGGSTLIAVDTTTNAIIRTISLDRRIDGLAGFGGRLWVSVG